MLTRDSGAGVVVGGASCCVTCWLCYDSLWPTPSRDAPAHGRGIWSSLQWEWRSQPRPTTNLGQCQPYHQLAAYRQWGHFWGPDGVILVCEALSSSNILSSALCPGFSFPSKAQTNEWGMELPRTTAPLRWMRVEVMALNTKATQPLSTGDRASCSPKGD